MRPIIDAFPHSTSVWQALAVVPRQPARAGYNELPRGTKYAPLAYNDFDLWLGLKGRSVVEILGQRRPFEAGTCLLLPPCVAATQTIADDADHHIAFFHFDMAHNGKVLRDALQYVNVTPHHTLELALPDLPSFALFTTLDTARLAERLLRAVRRWDDIAQLQSQSLVMGALAEHRREAVQPTSGRGRGATVVDAALEYLEEHLHRPVFVEEVASHLHLSPTHLTRLFRTQLKETPMQALVRMRLTRAQNLLLDPKLNIGEVALACGFDSLSFFSRVFNRKYGCPPTTYRRGLQRRSGKPQ